MMGPFFVASVHGRRGRESRGLWIVKSAWVRNTKDKVDTRTIMEVYASVTIRMLFLFGFDLARNTRGKVLRHSA